MKYITSDLLFEISPKYSGTKRVNQINIINEISSVFEEIIFMYDISTKLRIAHFLAQVTHECAGFCTTEEFASGEAYEGREDLGNTEPGDGKRYKGRGLIQLTGRYNYRKIGKILGLPLEENPKLAADPVISLKIACVFWTSRQLNNLADKNDLKGITKKINGGYNGLVQREICFNKVKELFDFIDGTTCITVRYNDNNFFVKHLQRKLNEKGFDISVDGDFGRKTFNAVISFQQKNHLADDGVVGKNTWTVLNR